MSDADASHKEAGEPDEGFVDLHLHSTRSDGSSTPEEVVARAREAGLRLISLTDHDSVDGVVEAQAAGIAQGVEVIPGAELSVQHEGRDVHVLAYFVDPDSSILATCLKTFRDERRNRAERIVKRLNRMGVRVRLEHVLAKADGGAVGRPHVADALVEEGICFSSNEAFNKYLGYGKPAYQKKSALTPAEAVEVIHDAGGVAIIAHPVLYRNDDLLPGLAEAGVDGIEVWHIKHQSGDVERYKAFAKRFDLLVSGGSDCHGDGRGNAVMGQVQVPYSVYENLQEGWCNRISA